MIPDADIFADALTLPFLDRETFVAAACGDDHAQRDRVIALLLAHEKAQVTLATPLTQRPPLPVSEAGTVIGCYKLLEKIGEGGCGVVWMAHQGVPVRRRVALKIIKLGMDTGEVIARFEAERQALALMEHPNIAKIFEAGATETGRPYFAMELVQGQPITRYCDERGVTLERRLALFTQVCRAIQHAHEKGVIHRDIKPSNILITHEDGEPLAKVIDFGIAKATQGRLTDRTLFTAFEQFIGTPAYMSPEQADLSAHEVDRRSDVYSLGALLYELVSGQPPFDPKTLTAHGIDEVRRIIRDVDPPRPSTRLGKLTAVERTTLAQRRGMAPAQHAQLIKGDLDWIAMKALDKSRARRYETATALAADVQCFLEHKPVQARPPSAAYVAGKFVRRHRLPLFAGTAVALALVLGAVASLWQARRAERAEREKEALVMSQRSSAPARARQPAEATITLPAPASPEALANARQLATVLREDFFADRLPEMREDNIEARAGAAVAAFDHVPVAQRGPEWAHERAWVSVRRVLAMRRRADDAVVQAGEAVVAEIEALRAGGDASDEATLLLALACLFPYDPIMPQRLFGGHPESVKWAPALQRAKALLLPLVMAEGSAENLRRLYAAVLCALGDSQPTGAAVELLRQGLVIVDELPREVQITPSVRLLRARLLYERGRRSEVRENVRRQQEVEALADSVLAEQPDSPAAQRLKIWARIRLAEVSHRVGDFAGELAHLDVAERLAYERQLQDPSNDDDWYALLIVRRALAPALIEVGRVSAAVAVLHRTPIDAQHPATDPTPAEGGARRYIKSALQSVALLEGERGNLRAAESASLAQKHYVSSLKVSGESSQRAALLRDTIGDARFERDMAVRRGDYASAVANGESTLAQLRGLLVGPGAREADRPNYHSEINWLLDRLAESYVMLGRYAAAETLLRNGGDLKPRGAPAATPAQLVWRALALARLGRGGEALDLVATARPLLPGSPGKGVAYFADREVQVRAYLAEAIAQPADEAGHARRQAALDEAQKIIDALSDEARALRTERILLKWVAEERVRTPVTAR